jgi:cell division protein FtsI/penicillin-binding protein 2
MIALLLLQTASSTAANAAQSASAAPPPLERQPALLSLVYMGGLLLMAIFLLISLVRNRRPKSTLAAFAPADLPQEVRERLGSTATNRGLRALRYLFVLLAIIVFSFHVYWAHYAESSNERFQELNYKDLRNRRLAESTLRGWILDRSGDLNKALARYARSGDKIVREYPLDAALSHLFGSERGDPGLERAMFGMQSGMVPEALQLVRGEAVKQQANQDVRLTIDRDLQLAAVEQLKGKYGAIVALNPQTGEVLALYSNPSYSPDEAQDEATWIKLEADKRDNPLLNRALSAYYIPGSTFKTMVMIAAHIAGLENEKFTCSGAGYVAAPGAKPIFDDKGPSEVHGTIGIDTAYEVSCNQYFAQMAVRLGPERMRNAARLLGIGAYDTPEEALRARKEPELWNASTEPIKRVLAPREATIVTNDKMRRYDLALEGYGQGYAGQMTPFQMALLASTIGNMEGKLMKPKIEYNRPPEVYNQVISPQKAAQMRAIMGLVTMGPQGTARGVFAPVKAAGINTGGKTGTAQKQVPEYDPKTGEPKTVKKYERDRKGNIIREYEEIVLSQEPRIDAWFLCIAPLERPQFAMAVIVEGGGYGSRAAAPIAAALVLKARDLGLLGDIPKDQNPPPTVPHQPVRAAQTARR